MRAHEKIWVPVLGIACAAALAVWAVPPGASDARKAGLIVGWLGCGMLIVSLFLVLREPRLAKWLGGLETMYEWHHRFGMAAYLALLAHPLLLAAAFLPSAPRKAWELLSPFSEGWPVWMGWLALVGLMAGLGATFASRIPYRLRRPLHAALGGAVVLGLLHLIALGVDRPVAPLLFAALALLAWRGLRGDWGLGAYPYVVRSVARISEGAVEIALAPLGERLPARPGQFALVAFDAGPRFEGCREFHPFTVSAVEGTSGFRIAVRALGDCTRRLQGVEPGALARVEGAFGDFLSGADAVRQYWIAGGVGITPFLSLLRGGRLERPTTLLYFFRARGEALFVDELHALAAASPQLTLRLIETGDVPADPAKAISATDDVEADEFWLCGPPPMVESFKRHLRRRGVAARHLHFESFGTL
jgi:predicted ferric reductase